MEGYFELVIDRLTDAGYRWYETANFCLAPERSGRRDLRARHNLGYWLGRDYLGLGIGAVSTLGEERRRNTPRLNAYVAALEQGEAPVREVEAVNARVRAQERVMLGLRLDTGLPLADAGESLDHAALGRLERLGLAARRAGGDSPETLVLTPRGRRLGGAVTAELLA
jgi:oxygen-independent coproporphyrinogen-3 oxidase